MTKTEPVKLVGLASNINEHTIEGWRRHYDDPYATRPVVVPAEERAHWSDEEQLRYDLVRQQYHARIPDIVTPEVRQILRGAMLQLQSNVFSTGVVNGFIVTGPATYGKSTLLRIIGRNYEKWFRTSFPPEDPEDAANVIPVVKVGLPEKATTKSFNISVAEFYGAVLSRRDSTRDEFQRVIRDRVAIHQTRLILVDDIHFLGRPNPDGNSGARRNLASMLSVNNHIKNLAEELGVTFGFAGINVDGTGLFDEGAVTDTVFSQIGGRMTRYHITGFDRGSAEWLALLAAFEDLLILDRHEPGTLAGLADYLYLRTGGSLGSLRSLLKLAALAAILRNKERIDYALLKGIKSDRNAEMNFEAHKHLFTEAR